MTYDPYSKTNRYIIEGCLVALGFYTAYQIRFEGAVPQEHRIQLWTLLPFVIAGRLVTNAVLRIDRHLWRFVSVVDAIHLAQSYVSFSGILLACRLLLPEQAALLRIPYSVISVELVLSFLAALSVRLLRRILYERQAHSNLRSLGQTRVLLLGATGVAVMAAKEIAARPDRKVVGFLDDDTRKIGAVINGIPVLGPLSQLGEVTTTHRVSEIVLCLGPVAKDMLKRIWQVCDELNVRTLVIPDVDEFIDGDVHVLRFRQATMEELLGREMLDDVTSPPEVASRYRGKRILITGAGGSIGSELARQLSRFDPQHLLLIDKDENGLYELQLQLADRISAHRFQLLLADVRSVSSLHNIFERFRPEIIFHAAAHKHVPLVEQNPSEAVLNNVFATRNIIEHATAYESSLFVFISTDKAVRPSSVLGATKRLGELLVQSQGNRAQTRFACVRFGNVMASRGSVIPLFQKQITAGGPVTLTDPAVTRYFMTIPEAVQLVVRVGLLGGENGSIYVLDMGSPVRVADLARDLIELAGLRPNTDIPIETIGLRPGEKLREELVGDGEDLVATGHPKIFAVHSSTGVCRQLEDLLGRLYDAAQRDNVEEIYHLFEEFNFGFQGSRANSSTVVRPESGSRIRADAAAPGTGS